MRSLCGFTASCAVIVIACSGGGGGGSMGSSSGATGGTFDTQLCDLIAPCCSAHGLATQRCRGINSGSTIDVAASDQCLSKLRALPSTQLCDDESVQRLLQEPPCVNVYVPPTATKAPGADCQEAKECARRPEGVAACIHFAVNGKQAGSCQIRAPGIEGDGPCTSTLVKGSSRDSVRPDDANARPPERAFTCEATAGLYCNATTAKCTRREAVGGVCTQDFFCADGLYCPTTSDAADNKKHCTARIVVGASCDPKSVSVEKTSTCVDNAFCTTDKPSTCIEKYSQGHGCAQQEQCASGRCEQQQTQQQDLCGDRDVHSTIWPSVCGQ